jgi:TonB family protein
MLSKIHYYFVIYFIVNFLCIPAIFSQNGIIRSYYSKKQIESEISYVNDVLDGTCYWYYENGNLKAEKTYDRGKLNGWVRFYFDNGLLKEEYFVENGILNGLAKAFYDNGGLQELRTYDKGILIDKSQVAYDSNYIAPVTAFDLGNRQTSTEDKAYEFLCDVKICAEPLGGMGEIQKKIVYPQHAVQYGLEGIVTLIATVDAEGNVTQTLVVNGIGLGCDEAAEKAVKSTRFIPGQDDSGVVESNVTLQIEFDLQKAIEKNKAIIEMASSIDPASAPKEEQTSNSKETIPDADRDQTDKRVNDKNDYIECDIEICPKPIGGIENLINNVIIPQEARELKLNGEIIIRAEIDEFGNVRDTELIKGIGYGCDEAAAAAILNSRFEPGLVDLKRVTAKVLLKIPIKQ